ncbi:type II toxin-antitoxin system RelE family toxin [Streptomyces specialis]|uniref:type II toxin-antitoxin system RelE family toxin n=1 Tax=Streptomyces specialis TaxID=498367 RepID=UPI00073F330F|nr:type II toxin-antitoxin system RelE/ParE family toxin [Streptomyces specialis]
MSAVEWLPQAKTAMKRYRQDDPKGIDMVLDSVNLLAKNPRPAGAHPYGPDHLRIHVGHYRIFYRIKQNRPVILEIQTVGRRN